MEKLDKIIGLVEDLKKDCERFYMKNNKSASTRARKALQEIRVLSKDLRLDISTTKKERGL